jgi:hypothetical protein
MTHRKLLLLGLLVVSTGFTFGGDLPDTYGNRIAAAERYLRVASMDDMMRDSIVETAKYMFCFDYLMISK